MKRIQLFFSVLAFILGIGGVIASASMPAQPQAYEYVADNVCNQITIECDIEGDFVCQVETGSPILRQNNMETDCGQELWRDTPPNR